MENRKHILVVAPHKDDEILGCGGMMARRIEEGHKVWVVVVTNGYIGAPELFSRERSEETKKECLAAHAFLGIEETFFLDFPAPRLDTEASYKISMALSKIVREHAITDMYLPHRGDIHKDHRITYEAALVAARPINNCTVESVFAYETLSETEWAAPFPDEAFIPTHFLRLTQGQIDRKIQAFEHFETQLKAPPHPRSTDAILNLAKMRGATISTFFAEAFHQIRTVE